MSNITVEEVQGEVVTKPALNLGQFCFPTQALATIQTGAAARATEVLGKLMVANSATRNVEHFRTHMLTQAEKLAFAEEAISLKPVGKGLEVKSVFLAKYMATEWGHIKWVTEDAGGDKASQVTGRVWDFQKNMEAEATVTVRHAKKKNDAIVDVVDPQDIQMLVKSETSKVIRNTIFSVLPPDIVKEVYEACLQTLDKYAAAELKDKDVLIKLYVDKLGVSKGEIFSWLKVDGPQDLKPIHVRRLKALIVGIKEGEVNPADIFKNAKDIPTKGQKEKKANKPDPKPSSTTEESAPDAVKPDAEPTADQTTEAEASAPPALTPDSSTSQKESNQESAQADSADTTTKETTSTTKETTSKSKSGQTEASDQSKPAKGKAEVSDEEKEAMKALFV